MHKNFLRIAAARLREQPLLAIHHCCWISLSCHGHWSVIALFYLTTRESLISHSRWALPHYTEMGHSSSSFWGTSSLGRGSNSRPPVPMALNIPEGHRGIGKFNIICAFRSFRVALFYIEGTQKLHFFFLFLFHQRTCVSKTNISKVLVEFDVIPMLRIKSHLFSTMAKAGIFTDESHQPFQFWEGGGLTSIFVII